MAAWLKSKFYPVDTTNRIIYNDPQPRERDCSYGNKYSTEYTCTIGLKAGKCPRTFSPTNEGNYTILPPISFTIGQEIRIYPHNPDTEELMDVIGVAGEIEGYIPSRYRTNGGNVWWVKFAGRALFFRTEELIAASAPQPEPRPSIMPYRRQVKNNDFVVAEFLMLIHWLNEQDNTIPLSKVISLYGEGVVIGRYWTEVLEDLKLPSKPDWGAE